MGWQILAAIAALGAAVAFVWNLAADRAMQARDAADRAATAVRVTQNTAWAEYARQEIATEAARTAEAEAARDAFKMKLDQRRPAYVTPAAVAACTLTAGLVRQHNDAAEGRAGVDREPGAAFAVDAPAGIGIDRYSAAVEANYATCHQWIERAQGWQRHAARSCRQWNQIYGRADPCPPDPDAVAGQPARPRPDPETKGIEK